MKFQNYIFIIGTDNLILSESAECKTRSGIPCQIPFTYGEMHYDTCINIDNGGVPWCFTNQSTGRWDACTASSCSNVEGKYFYDHEKQPK